jgi:dihydrodipicolinate synthase/N-acetylneuraminate lyase
MCKTDQTKTIPPVLPKRNITGYSAILLPFTSSGSIDWPAFDAHVERTQQAGLIPAVNMDTGYVNLLEETTRRDVLARTQAILGEQPYAAGAFVDDQPGADWNPDAYCREIEQIQTHNGIPVIFQSYGLTGQSNDDIMAAYKTIAKWTEQFIAFELGKMFAPFGAIYDLGVYCELMAIPQCIGAKHSSLHRQPEWDRLAMRDRQRPDFKVFTGNDLAIDMVRYGSDYLLGLSSFAPDLFGYRDRLWAAGDPAFYELNDLLQYLGFFAFRSPTPAYKHNAAQFLHLQGWIGCDDTHPDSPKRPDSDREILREIAERCQTWREQL